MIFAQQREEELNKLYIQLEENIESSEGDAETIQKLIEFKKVIATAITNEGIETLESDSAETMVENIGKILQVRTNGTATAEDITEGKTAWVNGEKIIGIAGSINAELNCVSNVTASGTKPTVTFSVTESASYFVEAICVSSSAAGVGSSNLYMTINNASSVKQNSWTQLSGYNTVFAVMLAYTFIADDSSVSVLVCPNSNSSISWNMRILLYEIL